jgi:hypothetical protein
MAPVAFDFFLPRLWAVGNFAYIVGVQSIARTCQKLGTSSPEYFLTQMRQEALAFCLKGFCLEHLCSWKVANICNPFFLYADINFLLKTVCFFKIKFLYIMKRNKIEENVAKHLIYGWSAQKITIIPVVGCVLSSKWT